MANDGTGIGWDIVAPADNEALKLGAQEIRDLRIGVGIRSDKEHVSIAAGSLGGEHLEGSGKIYYSAGAPTTRPNGDALTDADQGRMWFDSDTGVQLLKVYASVDTGWVDLIAPAVSVDAIKGTMIDWGDILNSAGAIVVADDEISVNLVADGGLEIDGNAIQVKAGSITDAMLATTVFPGSQYAAFAHTTLPTSNGGTATKETWETRTLNTTEVQEPESPTALASVSANVITINFVGTYKVSGYCIFHQTKASQTRFVRVAGGAQTEITGTTIFVHHDHHSGGASNFSGYIEVTNVTHSYKLEQYVEFNRDDYGYGRANEAASSLENNVYARVLIERIT